MREAAQPPAAERCIAIAGSGLAAWLTASALAKALPQGQWAVTVVPCDDAGAQEPFGLADAILPPPPDLHAALRLDEDCVVAATGGAFTAGIAFAGWSAPAAAWFHPFGPTGAQLGPVAFHHLLLRLRAHGRAARLANYSLAALAAQSGRFARPGDDPQTVLSTLAHGLHLEGPRLAALLRSAALDSGAATASAPLARVERDDGGAVAALVTADGARIEADLYVDASGSAARLAGEGPGSAWEDWAAWLPCDRVLSAVSHAAQAPPPCSLIEAQAAGWVRRVPLQGKTVLTAAWPGEHAGDEEIRALLERAGATPEEPGRLRPGRRKQPWHLNVLAVGTAAAQIEPLAVTHLDLLRRDVDRLLKLLPGDREARTEAAEYNRAAALLLDNARDFALLHYRLNGRRGEPFWDACRQAPLPPSLDYKLRLYESRGRVALYDEEPLEAESWIALFDECGVQPRRYNPLADGFPIADLEAHAERVRKIMLDALARMPSHGDYLARLGAASAELGR